MAANLQTTFSNSFFRIEIDLVWFKFPRSLFPTERCITPSLFQKMFWRWTGDKPLSESITVLFRNAHTFPRPQCVKSLYMHWQPRVAMALTLSLLVTPLVKTKLALSQFLTVQGSSNVNNHIPAVWLNNLETIILIVSRPRYIILS